jgi:hypothetical protein
VSTDFFLDAACWCGSTVIPVALLLPKNKQVVTRVQALFEAVDDDPPEKVRPGDVQN